MATVNEFLEVVKAGDAAKVTALLDADPELLDGTNETGQGAFLLAKYYGRDEVAGLLLARGPKLDIFTASAAGKVQLVAELLGRDKASLESHSSDGWTPLHMAAFFGQKSMAEVLIEHGADVNSRSTNAMKNTPLHAAVAGRGRDIVPVLLAHGAAVNAKQTAGWTALHAAAQNGDRELVEFLLANGADLSVRADNNQNALDLAMIKGHAEVSNLLDQLGSPE